MITPDTREYRSVQIRQEDLRDDYHITGLPVVFNSATVLWKDGDTEYKEIIAPEAFENCDMSDVVLNEDHQGTPRARTRNGSLSLDVETDGVHMDADLSGSRASRDLYEAVKNGLLDKMSFAFTVRKDEYDADTHTRTIRDIDKLYDVSCVTFPAYEQTMVSARSYFKAKAEAEAVAREAAEAAERDAEAKRVREEKRQALIARIKELEAR